MLSYKQLTSPCSRLAIAVVTMLLTAGHAGLAVAANSAESKPLRMVYIQVSIAVAGNETNTKISDQLQVTTLENSSANLQFGQQVSVPTSVTNLPGNRAVSHSYRQNQVGTIVKIEPRIAGDQIVVKLNLEKSWMEAPTSNSASGIASQYTTFTASVESTLAMADGKSQTVKARVSGAPHAEREAIVSITASLKPVASKQAASKTSRPAKPNKKPTARPSAMSEAKDSPVQPDAKPAVRLDHRNESAAKPESRKPTAFQTSGLRRIFELIDKDANGVISLEEWEADRLAQSMASRGVNFSKQMDLQQFETAVAEMKKDFRNDQSK